jgi:hypothetical protein
LGSPYAASEYAESAHHYGPSLFPDGSHHSDGGFHHGSPSSVTTPSPYMSNKGSPRMSNGTSPYLDAIGPDEARRQYAAQQMRLYQDNHNPAFPTQSLPEAGFPAPMSQPFPSQTPSMHSQPFPTQPLMLDNQPHFRQPPLFNPQNFQNQASRYPARRPIPVRKRSMSVGDYPYTPRPVY